MQSRFNVTAVNGDFSSKSIIIETTFAVDRNTVTKNNVTITDSKTGTQSVYSLDVNDNKIIATLKDWPDTETEYQVNITYIKDMLNRELFYPVVKLITFMPNIKDKASVLAPINNEVVFHQNGLIYIGIKVIKENGDILINPDPTLEGLFEKEIYENGSVTKDTSSYNYDFEISTDVAFFNIEETLTLNNYTDSAVQLNNGQYYIRARITSGSMVGDWSDVVTFTVSPLPCDSDDIVSDAEREYLKDVLAPVEFFLEEDKFEILSSSQNGELVEEFYIEFSKDIDIESLPLTISTFRRDI